MEEIKPVEVKVDISPSTNEQITNLLTPSTKQAGLALGNIIGLFNTLTLPLKYINTYAQHNFTKFEEKLKEIPIEQIKDVEPEIGIPIIEKLSYTKNEDLVNAYANLLANASRKDKVDVIHPGFINKINSMSPDEAKILELLKNTNEIYYIIFKAENDKGHYKKLSYKLTGIEQTLNITPKQMQIHLENLISLSILIDNEESYKLDDEGYNNLINKYLIEKNIYEQNLNQGMYSNMKKIEINKAYFSITAIGKTFIEACINN